MKRFFFIGLLIFIAAGCIKPGPNSKSAWQITSAMPENQFFSKGMTLVFEEERMKMIYGLKTIEIPVILSNDRFLADTGMTKILFSVVKTTDSTMVWNELYAATPLTIHLTFIRNHE